MKPGGAAISAGEALLERRGRVKRVYYPSVVLRLLIRLEDFSNEDGASAAQESKPAVSPTVAAARLDQAAGQGADVGAALGEVDVEGEASARTAAARAAAPPTGKDAAPPADAPRDDLSIELAVVPLECTVELNGFRIADKLTATFSLPDLPIAPDLVRAMLVEAYFGTSSSADFGDPERWIPNLLGTQAPVFRGYADVEDMEAGDDFKISISARSMEARLMDAKIHPQTRERKIQRVDTYADPETGKIVRGERVTRYLQRFVRTVPEFSGKGGDAIGVRIYPNFDPKLEPVLSAELFLRSIQTAQSRALAGGQVQGAPGPAVGATDPSSGTPTIPAASSSGDMTAWDIFVRASELVGLIPIYDPSIIARDPVSGALVRGADNILLVPPQNLKETPQEGISIPGGPLDGFERELLLGGAGDPIRTQVRFLVWGHNLKRAKFSRKFGRVKAPAVRVTCYDPDGASGKRVLVSQYPKTARGTLASPSGTGRGSLAKGHQPTTEVVTKTIRGIRSQKMLDQIAVSLYSAISRHEVTVAIETDEMASYIDPTRPETHNENPDLLRLRPGTPCRVTVARKVVDPAAGDLAVDALSTLLERRFDPAFLRKALLKGTAAAAIPAEQRARLDGALAKLESAFGRARLTDWFYTKVVNLRWTVDDGFSLSAELANYIEARNLPANLSAQDAARNDERKLVKPGSSRPRTAAAIAAEARKNAADENALDVLEQAALAGSPENLNL